MPLDDKTPMEGEPVFQLMGRDPQAPGLLYMWATERMAGIHEGRYPETDMVVVHEVRQLAHQMHQWREQNDGQWRLYNPELPLSITDVLPDPGQILTDDTMNGDKPKLFPSDMELYPNAPHLRR